ncbi:MAG: Xaa-Pro peptidase family protein [Planctomycetota bacterium]|jgi:Xaa-Pro aminopeptidase|nr:Xaa-Pro peptidase family protein [Planctomycetota bacterium]
MKESPFSRRRAALFQTLDRLGLDAAILDDRDDIYYYTGYTGSDALALFSATRRHSRLITDPRFREEAEKSAPGVETIIWRDSAATEAGKILCHIGAQKAGITPDSLRTAVFYAMRRRAAPIRAWRSLGPEISDQRAVKDAGEIRAVEKALACAEAAFLAARGRWRAGMTEIEVKQDLEWEMRRRGADDVAFETIAAAGANTSLPHAHAGRRRIRPGKALLVDFGARVNRYHSDLTRTLWCGGIPGTWLKRYQAVCAANQIGRDAIRAGVSCRAVDAEARRFLDSVGLGGFFSHTLGHGVGLAIHEEPRLGSRSPHALAPGNIVTVEPGIYLPGAGGIRVEDMVLVTADGSRTLSSLPRGVDSLVF